VELLEEGLTGVHVEWAIFSALHGLVSSEEWVAPYDETLQGLGQIRLRERGAGLGMPGDYLELLQGFDVVFHMLSNAYFTALCLNGSQLPQEPVLAYIGGAYMRFLPATPRIQQLRVSRELCHQHHAASVALKGAIFLAVATRLAARSEALEQLIRDPSTIVDLARPLEPAGSLSARRASEDWGACVASPQEE
jgi:hypothetical protein